MSTKNADEVMIEALHNNNMTDGRGRRETTDDGQSSMRLALLTFKSSELKSIHIYTKINKTLKQRKSPYYHKVKTQGPPSISAESSWGLGQILSTLMSIP